MVVTMTEKIFDKSRTNAVNECYATCGSCCNIVQISERQPNDKENNADLPDAFNLSEDDSFHVGVERGGAKNLADAKYVECTVADLSKKRKRETLPNDEVSTDTNSSDASPALLPRRIDSPVQLPTKSVEQNCFSDESYQSPKNIIRVGSLPPPLDIRRELTTPERSNKLGCSYNFGPIRGPKFKLYCEMDRVIEERFVIFARSTANVWRARQQVEFAMLLDYVNAHAPLYDILPFDERESRKILQILCDCDVLRIEERGRNRCCIVPKGGSF